MISKFRRRLLIDAARKNNNITYPGLIAAWSAKGKSNDDADRDVLRDLTGNGHDITLNGFAFNTEGSGYGHPEYPDALVFDGVDDYGINEGMPILTDFTIITDRIILNPETDGSVINQIKCFMTERRSKQTSTYSDVASFDTYNSGIKNIIPDKISWLTSTNFNQFAIKKGSSIADSTLYLGTRSHNISALWQGAFYSAYLFDRSLDEQEIKAFIRKYIDADYLLPSEQTTE